MRALITVAAVAATFGVSCNRANAPKDPGVPGVAYEVQIWIEDDPRLPADDVLRGCAEWRKEGIACERTSDEKRADIRVYADDGECTRWDPVQKRQRTTLAWAFSGGDIKMMAKCMDASDGKMDSKQLGAVTEHEVGHQLGIWDHVPYSCKGDDVKKHPSGKPVCGTAVMNPNYQPDVLHLTAIDHLAFEVRDPLHSVLLADRPAGPPPDPDKPDCVYYAP